MNAEELTIGGKQPKRAKNDTSEIRKQRTPIMEINFIGPLNKVTGSCTWMRDKKRKWNFLIDCGMQQGEKTAAEWNNQDWPFDPAEIQFIILTHAHIDHCGLIPVLYRDGFTGVVYCTEETAKIATILLKNAMNLSPDLFNHSHIRKIRWTTFNDRSKPVLGGYHPIDNDLFIQFHRTGHILGAVSASVVWGPIGPDQRKIVFSGDIGPQQEDREVLPTILHTMKPGPHNYAVMESTYGGIIREACDKDPKKRREHLKRLLFRTVSSGGTLIIPSFALGRSHDVMFDLHTLVAEDPDTLSGINFYYDLPLGRKLFNETNAHWSKTENSGNKVRLMWLGKQVFELFGLIHNDKESINQAIKALDAICMDRNDPSWEPITSGNYIARNWAPIFTKETPDLDHISRSKAPNVIVTGSGNCEAGKAATWLPKLATKINTIIAITGYCGSGSAGGKLLSIANLPIHERQLDSTVISWQTGERVTTVPVSDIQADIEKIKGYSAHADQKDLLNWAISPYKGETQVAGETTFLQHGTDQNRKKLREELQNAAKKERVNIDVRLPDSDTGWISLEKAETTAEDYDKDTLQEILSRRPDLKASLGT
jgi:metallo-beta-lactamase family protein